MYQRNAEKIKISQSSRTSYCTSLTLFQWGLQNLFTPTKAVGVCLQNDGVYFVKELNAQKARLKLLIAINAGLKGDELQAYMEG